MHKTDRFVSKKWGVMCHLLHNLQNNPERPSNEGVGRTPWNEFISQIDVKNIAEELHEMGAGYFLLTIMQGDPYMIAPNATYDRIVGSAPGEYCSERDLVLDLGNELRKYDIDLFLYFTGDGPHKNVQTGNAIGFQDRYNEAPIPERFLKNWTSVLKEYAERYKDVVKGWWIDGLYPYFGYDDEKIKYYHDTLKSVNPDWIVAYNDGHTVELAWQKEELAYDPTNDNPQPLPYPLFKRSIYEDFLAGEEIEDGDISALISARRLFPVLFGSALRMTGIDFLLDTIDRYSLSPQYESERFGARVFKIAEAPSNAGGKKYFSTELFTFAASSLFPAKSNAPYQRAWISTG